MFSITMGHSTFLNMTSKNMGRLYIYIYIYLPERPLFSYRNPTDVTSFSYDAFEKSVNRISAKNSELPFYACLPRTDTHVYWLKRVWKRR